MVPAISLPPLRPEYEPTRATLHAYAHAASAVPRAHGIAHPRWWHVGLKVRPDGLVTDPVPLPEGGTLALTMDLRRHEIALRSSDGGERRFDMTAGMTGTELADALISAATEHALDGPYDRDRFDDDAPRAYQPEAAEAYFEAFTGSAIAFETRRVALGDRVGPIQVWPHGFDLAFEWFAARRVPHDGDELTAQLNLGFYPGGDPYFYSNPWPFDERLLGTALPHGARWTTEGFQGSILPYALLQGSPDAGTKLVEYARAVHRAAAPTLEHG
jgi:hypothetical protein